MMDEIKILGETTLIYGGGFIYVWTKLPANDKHT